MIFTLPPTKTLAPTPTPPFTTNAPLFVSLDCVGSVIVNTPVAVMADTNFIFPAILTSSKYFPILIIEFPAYCPLILPILILLFRFVIVPILISVLIGELSMFLQYKVVVVVLLPTYKLAPIPTPPFTINAPVELDVV